MDEPKLLDSKQMAEFAARGVLRFDGVVPDEINERFCTDAAGREIPVVPAGTPLDEAYAPGTPIHGLVSLPRVRGAIESLVGPGSLVDHHFLHLALPPASFEKRGLRQSSQPTHQDSTIDPRMAFDAQLFYFPHAVTREMGGTRYIPGSHLRIVSEAAIGRYQNIRGQQHVVCPAGTVMLAHHGLWHGGGINRSDRMRFMFKIRLNPTVRQCRLWDTSDLGPAHGEQRPIFWLREAPDPEHLHSILCRLEPWFEQDTGRLEILNRIRLWRFLLGDDEFDADYWLTRLENAPEAAAQ
ncbi:MAG: phytanoyl-CoA dioxygenase family protein [Deltaproteobacteria bacterium]|nr:phytanoyl-CoA dioxygenase family protein [Deltaproteobacteria bacterium]